ncbi:MAG: MFS transporter [Proteobacteria bacterium]|nr:MFS transporter [Pseudomonadota bacterium]
MNAQLPRLVAAQICIHGCLTGLRMAAPLWALRTYDSAMIAGLLLALFAVSQVFIALPAGRYVDRHGLTRPIGISVLLASVGAVLPALHPAIYTLALGALLTGAASGLTIIALQRHIGHMARDGADRRRLFSWLAIGPSVSNVVGPLLAGVVIDAAGFRVAFVALALLPLLTWLAARGLGATATHVPVVGGASGRAWHLLRRPKFAHLLFVNWLLSSSWDVYTFMVPVIGHHHDFSASAIGTILGVFASATAAVRVLMPWLGKHLRERQVLIAALMTTAVLFAIFPLMTNPLSMAIGSILLGLALGSVQPMIMSNLHQLVPPERVGEAIALRLMVINASSVVMPLILGSAGVVLGTSMVFWVVGGAAAGGAWVARRIS